MNDLPTKDGGNVAQIRPREWLMPAGLFAGLVSWNLLASLPQELPPDLSYFVFGALGVQPPLVALWTVCSVPRSFFKYAASLWAAVMLSFSMLSIENDAIQVLMFFLFGYFGSVLFLGFCLALPGWEIQPPSIASQSVRPAKRRPTRFSLRGLFLCMVLIATTFAFGRWCLPQDFVTDKSSDEWLISTLSDFVVYLPIILLIVSLDYFPVYLLVPVAIHAKRKTTLVAIVAVGLFLYPLYYFVALKVTWIEITFFDAILRWAGGLTVIAVAVGTLRLAGYRGGLRKPVIQSNNP